MQKYKFCFVSNRRMQTWGLPALGYSSWEDLWADYIVFTMVRNPYDRVASAYDYILGRREVRPFHTRGLLWSCAALKGADWCSRVVRWQLWPFLWRFLEPQH